MKQCSKCKETKTVDHFRKDSTRKDGLQSQCKECRQSTIKEAYDLKYKEVARSSAKRRVNKNYALIIEYKTSKGCACCSEKESCCLEFHHLDPAKKEFQIANRSSNSWDNILLEIEKCVVLCSNCHKKVHAGIITLSS